jgi:hypothetical protein
VTNGKDAPLIVDRLGELPPVPGGWVFVRESAQLYVERDGAWVPYVEPPPSSLWSMLEDDT